MYVYEHHNPKMKLVNIAGVYYTIMQVLQFYWWCWRIGIGHVLGACIFLLRFMFLHPLCVYLYLLDVVCNDYDSIHDFYHLWNMSCSNSCRRLGMVRFVHDYDVIYLERINISLCFPDRTIFRHIIHFTLTIQHRCAIFS